MENILVLTDVSAASSRAAECALTIASRVGADMLLVNVYPIMPYLPVALATLPQRGAEEKRRESTGSLNLEARPLEKRLWSLELTGYRPVIRFIPLEGQLADFVSDLVRRKNGVLIMMGLYRLFYKNPLKEAIEHGNTPLLVFSRKSPCPCP
jgi:nucleotide-binding universal stress UspA family protein